MRALLPSGKLPTTRVRRLISRLSRSIMLFVWILLRCPAGYSGSRQVIVSPFPSRRQLAAALSLLPSICLATSPALARAAGIVHFRRSAGGRESDVARTGRRRLARMRDRCRLERIPHRHAISQRHRLTPRTRPKAPQSSYRPSSIRRRRASASPASRSAGRRPDLWTADSLRRAAAACSKRVPSAA